MTTLTCILLNCFKAMFVGGIINHLPFICTLCPLCIHISILVRICPYFRFMIIFLSQVATRVLHTAMACDPHAIADEYCFSQLLWRQWGALCML